MLNEEKKKTGKGKNTSIHLCLVDYSTLTLSTGPFSVERVFGLVHFQ